MSLLFSKLKRIMGYTFILKRTQSLFYAFAAVAAKAFQTTETDLQQRIFLRGATPYNNGFS